MGKFWRYALATFAALLAVVAAAYFWLTRPLPLLTVASWGGAYTGAQTDGIFRPYTNKYDVNVHVSVYGGGIKDIEAQITSRTIDWDVVDFEMADANAACRAGLLETIDPVLLPPAANGTKATDDFIPGALRPCFVGGIVFSHVIAYAPRAFSAPPVKLSDFFNLAAFPGARGLRASGPEDNLEMALLADGVAPADVYATLATNAGADRAFAKFDTIKKNIVWWRKSSDALAMLNDGRATMITALNGALYDAASAGESTKILWDGQRYEFEAFGIVKGTPRKKEAMDFVRFATAGMRIAKVAGREALRTGKLLGA